MTAIGLTVQTQTHRHAGFTLQDLCDCVCVCVCACASGALYIQLSRRQSVYSSFASLHAIHLYAFYLPIHVYPRLCGEIWLADTPLMPCVTQVRNHPHANVGACNNAMSELKKTRDKTLPVSVMLPRLLISWPDSQ